MEGWLRLPGEFCSTVGRGTGDRVGEKGSKNIAQAYGETFHSTHATCAINSETCSCSNFTFLAATSTYPSFVGLVLLWIEVGNCKCSSRSFQTKFVPVGNNFVPSHKTGKLLLLSKCFEKF